MPKSSSTSKKEPSKITKNKNLKKKTKKSKKTPLFTFSLDEIYLSGLIIFSVLMILLVSYQIMIPVTTAGNYLSQATLRELRAVEKGSDYHVEIPDVVRGIYLSAATVGHSRFNDLLNFTERTEINSMVIDVKNQNGALAFIPENEELLPYVSKTRTPLEDLEEVMKVLHEKNIYKIARVPVFLDPWFASIHPEYAVKTSSGSVWRDWKGSTWLEAPQRGVWEYNLKIAKEMYERGFDEIQFDYIRFPSDGPVRQIQYSVDLNETPKNEVMKSFFKYLYENLREAENIPISVDLFGLTFWNLDFDLNIGQKLEDALPYFDYISPMVYPSHYPNGYLGLDNPADHPYEVISQNMKKGKTLYEEYDLPFTARPWLQDFDIGAIYDAPKIRAQIDATEETGANGWILWNARNVYTEWAFPEINENNQS